MELFSQLLPFIFLIAIMYFVIIRPQQKEAKARKDMIASLKKGDRIITGGGLIVEIKKVEEKFLIVAIDKENTAKLVKDSVSRKYEDEV
ncbi:preprotein translocase subunit YajC [Sulfurimonas sp. HSL-1716]|uniref:preprotein translocase subunit YajC n=1 Tax=Hydrocurvibacter sulfurireducens TaxID=3131937 RepID=UPI0031F95311